MTVNYATGEVLTAEEWAQTPTEVAVIGGATSALAATGDDITGALVTAALQESLQWLEVAMTKTDPTPIAEFKAWAATVLEATKQKKLGRQIELDAAEMVRRAERGIGVAIRNGQDAGEIATHSESASYAGRKSAAQRLGETEPLKSKPAPSDFANYDELTGNGAGIYHLTDNVTDEEFEVAVTECKAEENLSRANVVRKVKQAPAPASGNRPELLHRTRRHDANRIVEQTVIGLEGFVLGVALIDFDALDRSQITAWSSSLNASLQSLNRLSRQLKELDQA